MLVSVATMLAEFLFSSAASGVVGDAAYEAIQDWWKNKHRSSLEEVYVQAFLDATKTLEPTLTKHAEPSSQITVDPGRLLDIFRQSASDLQQTGSDTDSFLKALAAKIATSQVLMIPGHQLTPLEYQGLVLEVLQIAWQHIYREISYDDFLFRESVKHAVQGIQVSEAEVITAIQNGETSIKQVLFDAVGNLNTQLLQLSEEHQAILNILMHTPAEKPHPTYESILAKSRMQVEKAVGQAFGQYIRERYVNRLQVESEFGSSFLPSDKNCYLVLGRAGEGKTNLMCYLAETNAPSLLFLIGRQFDLGHSIQTAIQQLVGTNSITTDSFKESLDELNGVLEQQNSRLLIFIDAINEHPNPDGFSIALTTLINTIAGTRLKLVISCRDTEWSRFHDNDVLRASLFNPVQGTLNLKSLEQASIKLFSGQEFGKAWELYRSYYKLEGNLTAELRSLCRDPFMLYLLGESYSNREVKREKHYVLPQTATRLQLFDKYWERKVPRHEAALQHSLYALARHRREVPASVDFSSFDVAGLLKTHTAVPDPYSIYRKLLSEKILIQTGEEQVRFTYDLVYEST